MFEDQLPEKSEQPEGSFNIDDQEKVVKWEYTYEEVTVNFSTEVGSFE